jgi:Gnt-I system low-affinity gluconate transporter
MIDGAQPLLVTGGAVVLLLWLVLHLRMSAFLALMVTSLLAAVAAGMPPMAAIDTVKNGMGGTLGFIAVIVGLGSIFGALLQASGGIEALADAFSRRARPSLIPWLMGLLGLIVAVPVFFDVALIILAPVVFGLASRLGRAPVLLAIPLLAGLATAHAFVPPTPGPMAVADLLGADIGWVALFGAIAGLPAMLVAGPLWARMIRRLPLPAAPDMPGTPSDAPQATSRSNPAGRAFAVIALPLVLILMATLAPLAGFSGGTSGILVFIGHPFAALLLSCGAAYLLFRPTTPDERQRLRTAVERALEPAGAVILVTGAGGAFKQVLVDTGAGKVLADAALGLGLVPVVAGFLLALLVRVAQGSATVAMITAAGLTAPIVDAAGLNPPQTALAVVAIAAGAPAPSHVNDSGFWLVSRYFSLDTATTLKTWTICATLIGFVGFAVTLLLSAFI